MKLLEYPHCVQKEILHNIEYQNLFLLSFVSRKTKKLIKSSQIVRFKSIHFIEYGYGLMNEPIARIPYGRTFGNILQLSTRYDNNSNSDCQLNVLGKIIDFRVSEYTCPMAFCQPWESVINSIHNYLIDLFGDSVDYRWRTSYERDKFFIPQLQNMSACSISFDGTAEDLEKVENFFSSSPVFKRIEFHTFYRQFSIFGFGSQWSPAIVEPFSPESKLYQAESIRIFQREHTYPAILRHFQGRQAFIKCDKCDISDLISFLNRWKSADAFQNLEYLTIELCLDAMPRNEILNAIGAKYISPTKKPPTHTLPKKFIEYVDAELKTNPITSHTYVVRETDSFVASILIQEKTLSFGAWNKTEEEFLRMVE